MTPEQRDSLKWFRQQAVWLNRQPIAWDQVAYPTALLLNDLSERLGHPLVLIRGNHGPDGSAIDFYCPDVPFRRLVMEVLRLPCSFGIYSGLTIHADTRPLTPGQLPARWMAMKPDEEAYLGPMVELIYRRADGWSYLAWSHENSWEALRIVVNLAELKSGDRGRISAV